MRVEDTIDVDVGHGTVTVDGVRLHYVEAGSGPLAVLLHGFPKCWYAWHDYFDPLVDAGYHVVALDMRGYNGSDAPSGVENYRLSELAGDVRGVIEKFDADDATLVGDDWGGIVAWETAIRYPSIVSELAVTNAPHPDASKQQIWDLSRNKGTAYLCFFQLPVLPEATVRSANHFVLRKQFSDHPTVPEAYTKREVDKYVDAIAAPGSLTAAINYDRAFLREAVRDRLPFGGCARAAGPEVDVPTLVLWGERDRFYSKDLLDPLAEWVPDLTVERYPNGSHSLIAEHPEDVADRLCRFLSEPETKAPSAGADRRVGPTS